MKNESKGLLAVWMNVDPAHADDFNAWYVREHIPERVGVPGFHNGRRFQAIQADRQYFAAYDTETAEVLFSPDYLQRLNNPTPWTKRIMPAFQDTIRCTCRVIADMGEGAGAIVRAYRFEPQSGARERLSGALPQILPESLPDQSGIVRIRCAERVDASESPKTAEADLRVPDAAATFVLLVEGTEEQTLDAACGQLGLPQKLVELGAAEPIISGDFRLNYTLTA